MWHLGTWFRGEHSGAGFMVELSDLRGLSCPKQFYDSEFSRKEEAAVLLFLTSADLLAYFS